MFCRTRKGRNDETPRRGKESRDNNNQQQHLALHNIIHTTDEKEKRNHKKKSKIHSINPSFAETAQSTTQQRNAGYIFNREGGVRENPFFPTIREPRVLYRIICILLYLSIVYLELNLEAKGASLPCCGENAGALFRGISCPDCGVLVHLERMTLESDCVCCFSTLTARSPLKSYTKAVGYHSFS